MKKIILILSSLWLATQIGPAYAESSDSVIQLQESIQAKEAELNELRDQLRDFSQITVSAAELIGQFYEHEGIEVSITDIYYTDQRNEFEDEDFDNVLVLEYILQNNTGEEYSTGWEFELFVDNLIANDYYFSENKNTVLSKNRKAETRVAFGFNGNPNLIELELSNYYAWGNVDPVIISVTGIQKK